MKPWMKISLLILVPFLLFLTGIQLHSKFITNLPIPILFIEMFFGRLAVSVCENDYRHGTKNPFVKKFVIFSRSFF